MQVRAVLRPGVAGFPLSFGSGLSDDSGTVRWTAHPRERYGV
jgi:hypothetical protein